MATENYKIGPEVGEIQAFGHCDIYGHYSEDDSYIDAIPRPDKSRLYVNLTCLKYNGHSIYNNDTVYGKDMTFPAIYIETSKAYYIAFLPFVVEAQLKSWPDYGDVFIVLFTDKQTHLPDNFPNLSEFSVLNNYSGYSSSEVLSQIILKPLYNYDGIPVRLDIRPHVISSPKTAGIYIEFEHGACLNVSNIKEKRWANSLLQVWYKNK